MSIILDALNRSRQDTEQVPGLATQHYDAYADDDARRSIRSYLPWLALLVAAAIIAWLLVDRNAGDVAPELSPPAMRSPEAVPDNGVSSRELAPQKPVAKQATGAEQPTAPVRTVPPQPAVSLAQRAVQEKPLAQERTSKAVANLYQDRAQADTSAATKAQSDAGKRVASAVATTRGRESMSSETPAVTRGVVGEKTGMDQPLNRESGAATLKPTAEQVVEEEPIDIEALVLKARNEVENARLEEHSAPFITELSQQAKDDIPTIFYERHDYSGRAGQSSVVLNGKTLKEGGRLGAGLKVTEILSDSVVLDHRGTQFRLRALNSWINL